MVVEQTCRKKKFVLTEFFTKLTRISISKFYFFISITKTNGLKIIIIKIPVACLKAYIFKSRKESGFKSVAGMVL